MNLTSRYLQCGNGVCGTPPDTDTGLTREEEKEVLRGSLFVLAETGFIQIDKNEKIIIPEKLECLGFVFWLSGYFSTSEIEVLRQELQKAYDEGGDNLFNMACLASDDNRRIIGAAA